MSSLFPSPAGFGLRSSTKAAPGHTLLALSALSLAALIPPVCAGAQPGYGLLAANVDTQENHFYLYYLEGANQNPPYNLIQYDPLSSNNTPKTLTTKTPNFYPGSKITGVGLGPLVSYDAPTMTTPASSPYRLVAYVNPEDNMNEVFYLTNPPATSASCLNPNGCRDIEQIRSDAGYFADITQQAGAVPAAINTSLAGYVDSCAGTNNVFYVGNDQHVHLLTSSAKSGWLFSDVDLTEKTNAGIITVSGGALAGHIFAPNTPAQSENVYYLGSNGLVNEMSLLTSGGQGCGPVSWPGFEWAGFPLEGQNAAIGSPLADFYDAAANSDSVFYVGTDNNLWEFYRYQHLVSLPTLHAEWTQVNINITKGTTGTMPSGMFFTDPATSSGACPSTATLPCWSSLAAHVNTTTQPQYIEEVFFMVPGPPQSGEVHVFELTAPSTRLAPPVWTLQGAIGQYESSYPFITTPLVPVAIPILPGDSSPSHIPAVWDNVYFIYNATLSELTSTSGTSGAGSWTLETNFDGFGEIIPYGQ